MRISAIGQRFGNANLSKLTDQGFVEKPQLLDVLEHILQQNPNAEVEFDRSRPYLTLATISN